MAKNLRLEEDGSVCGEFVFADKKYEDAVKNKSSYLVTNGFGYTDDSGTVIEYSFNFFSLAAGTAFDEWYKVEEENSGQLEFDF